MERGDDTIVFRNVKELLDTGQLEGLPVTYVSERYNARLDGFIRGNQYACGCKDCNFKQVISAKKFEEHASSTSNHANNHIVLRNGEKLHQIAKSLSNIPSKEFHEKLRRILNGCLVNEESDSGSDWENEDLEEVTIPRNTWLPLDAFRRSLRNPKRRRSPDPLFIPRKRRTSGRRQRAYSHSDDLLPSQRDSNITPDTFIKHVKDLLSTGLLEGFPIYYEKGDVSIDGKVRGLMYQCGCEKCNFQSVVSATEFEKHAGANSKNQNNHIHLQSNTTTLYRLVKALLGNTLGSLDRVIEAEIGCRPNIERFNQWKASFQEPRIEAQEASGGGVGIRQTGRRSVRTRRNDYRKLQIQPDYRLLASFQEPRIEVQETSGSGVEIRESEHQNIRTSANGYGKAQTQPDLRCENDMFLASFQQPIFEVQETSGRDVEIRQTEHQNITISANDYGKIQIQPDLHCEDDMLLASLQQPRIEVQDTSRSDVEIRQTEHQNITTSANYYGKRQIQPNLHCEDVRLSPSFQELRIEVQETSGSGAEIQQTEHQNITTSANDFGKTQIQPYLHCEDMLFLSFQEPIIEVQEISGSGVEIQQAEHQNITTSANDYEKSQIQPDLHCEDDRLLPSFQEPRIEVQETSGSGVEIQQTGHQNITTSANDYGKAQIQPDLHCKDDRLLPSFQEPRIEVQETSRSGVEIRANDFGKVNIQPDLHCKDDSLDSLQEPRIEVRKTSGSVETSVNDSGKVQIQPDHHCEDDSIGVGSLQTCSQFGLLPWRNNQGKLHSEHSNQISTSKDGIEGLQTPPWVQLQTTHPNSSVNLHTHQDTNLINGSESIPTQPGFIHTEPQLDIRNGVESPQVQIGQQLRRTCPNDSGTMGTEPSLPAYSEERNDTLLGNKSFVQHLEGCEIGYKDPHTRSEVNMEPHSHNRGPTEDSTNPTPSISTLAIKEKRPMLEDTSKHKFMSKSDSRRAIFMDDGLPDGSELSYRNKGQIKRRGIKVKDGIVCLCCDVKMSPSKFESHAGHPETRQPYKNIYYDKEDITLDQFCDRLMRGQNSLKMAAGKCRICEGGGELIPCKCSNTFHAGCLKRQCAVDGYLRCLDCQLNLGPDSVTRSMSSSANGLENHRLRRNFVDVVEEYGRGCSICDDKTVCIGPADDNAVIACRQCEKEYHLGCLKRNGCNIELEKEIENPPWFCSSRCCVINYALFSAVRRESMVIHESPLGSFKWNDEEKQAKMEWQILSGQLKSSTLLDKVTAFFEDSFEPILRGGHNLLNSMVHGAQSHAGKYRGMCCAVLIVESVIVSAGIFRIFGTTVAELPLVATLKGSRNKGYFRTLLCLIERLLSFLGVEVLMVPIENKQRKMWKKFGFKPMTEHQLFEYASEHPIIRFADTTMLGKEIPYIEENMHTAIANNMELMKKIQ